VKGFSPLVMGVILAGRAGAGTQSAGQDFGDEMRMVMTARQAASGGVAIEDPWRQGTFIEATTIVLASGMRWLGFGAQAGAGTDWRLGAEAFAFSPGDIAGTRELQDGTFGGETGNIRAVSWGASMVSQWTLVQTDAWRVATLARAIGLVQQLPNENNAGVAIAGGLQAQRVTGSGAALTAWGYLGPLGSGAGRTFAGRFTLGAGWMAQMSAGLLGGPEGLGLGAEGDILTEALVQEGAGAVYWFGRLGDPGGTLFVRLGLKHAPASAQSIQPRAGLGLLWRLPSGLGLQFDYALSTLGELGLVHYATIGLRLAPSQPVSRIIQERAVVDEGE